MKYYYQTASFSIASDVILDQLPACPPVSEADIKIYQGLPLEGKERETASNLYRMEVNPDYLLVEEGFQLDWKEHGLYQIRQGKEIVYDARAAKSPHFQHFLINEVMAGIFFQRGMFLLHGAAALLPNGTAAVLFGEPGAGKSTTLGMLVKHGAKVLSDEIVVLDFRPERIYIRPFVPLLRLWGRSAAYLGYGGEDETRKYEIPVRALDEPVKLSAAFSLRRSNEFGIRPLADHSFHLDLFGNFPLPRPVLNPAEQMRRFQQAAEIIQCCTTYQINRTEDSFKEVEDWMAELTQA